MTPLHLGALHGIEGFAVLVLALGPMVVCVVTVLYLRWRGERRGSPSQGAP
jgi:hypothetical protein